MKWFDPLRGLALVTLLALQGCGGTAQEQSASQNATEAAPSEAKPFVVRHEDYKDADFRSTPRLQFTWSPPGAPDNAHGRGIWTIRLDGSDLRLAVPPELLYETGPGATNADVPFERSPDFRYIAVATQPQCPSACYQRRLIDLETGTSKVLLNDGAGPPRFQWTRDSRYLYFKASGNLYRYDVQQDSLVNLENKLHTSSSTVQALVNDDSQWLSELGDQISRYDLESGELISRNTLAGVTQISPDKKFLIRYNRPKHTYEIFLTNGLASPVFSFPAEPGPRLVLGKLEHPILAVMNYHTGPELEQYQWATSERIRVAKLPKGSGTLENLSLIGLR